MSLPRILVTDADTTKALAIVRALGPHAEVWTASKSRWDLGGWSRYGKKHLVYHFDSPRDLIPWLLEACKKNEIRILITPEEPSSFLVCSEREHFQDLGVLVAAPPVDVLRMVQDKALTIQAARTVSVPIPPTQVLGDAEEGLAAARGLGYPLVVKSRFSYCWNGTRLLNTGGVYYANSDESLMQALQSLPRWAPPPLLQKYVKGRGLGVSVLLDSRGELCAEFAHERVRDLRPTGSGSVLRRSVPVDPVLREMSLSLLRHIGWWGVAMVEFRKDQETKEVYLMEVNGRFWGSLQLAVDAGVNFPKLLAEMLLGKPLKPVAYRDGVVLRWWMGDLFRTVRILKGKPTGFTDSFPSRCSGIRDFLGLQSPGTRNEVFRWDDPWPAVGEVASFLVRRS